MATGLTQRGTGAVFHSNIVEVLQDIKTKGGEDVMRPSAYAGAKVLHQLLLIKVAPHRKTGNLYNAVYHWHNDKKSQQYVQEVYTIGVNMKKAPHWHLLEFGHMRINKVIKLPDGTWRGFKTRLPAPKWIPGEPYLRPTWVEGKGPAVAAMKKRLKEKFDELKIKVARPVP